MSGFNGFTQDAFKFFLELTFNNNRTFFQANRERYLKSVREPLTLLFNELAPTALAIDPQIEVRPTSAIARLNRDTRFSNDKSPYKTHLWLVFRRNDGGCLAEAMAFYFELGADYYFHGLGMYGPNKPFMDKFRERAQRLPKEFERMSAKAMGKFELRGEDYKRERFPDAPEALKPWLNKKYFYLHSGQSDVSKAMTPALADELREGMLMLSELYAFFMECK